MKKERIKILAIGNYSPWNRVVSGRMPSHHLFGIHQMLEHYEKNGNKIRGYLKDNKGIVDFYDTSGKGLFINLMVLFFKSFKYDILYDFMNCISKQLGVVRLFLRASKLVTIMHHPPFDKQMKYGLSDAYIFLDTIYKEMVDPSILQKRKCYSVNWLPDVAWYSSIQINNEGVKYSFIDNGKTFRDHELLLKVLYEIGEKSVLINKAEYRPSNFIEGGCVDFIELKKPDDVFLLNYIMRSKVVIIPLKETGKMLGPVGNTSFMDCLALAKPLVCSDNVYFSNIVKEYGLGICYRAGDAASMKKALVSLINSESLMTECSNHIRQYMENKSVEKYAESIRRIFNDVLE